MKRILRITYLSCAIGGMLGGTLALADDDVSEMMAWYTAVAMAGAGFLRETDEE